MHEKSYKLLLSISTSALIVTSTLTLVIRWFSNFYKSNFSQLVFCWTRKFSNSSNSFCRIFLIGQRSIFQDGLKFNVYKIYINTLSLTLKKWLSSHVVEFPKSEREGGRETEKYSAVFYKKINIQFTIKPKNNNKKVGKRKWIQKCT